MALEAIYRDRVYVHDKSGGLYAVRRIIPLKMEAGDTEAVIYYPYAVLRMWEEYARPIEEFKAKFSEAPR